MTSVESKNSDQLSGASYDDWRAWARVLLTPLAYACALTPVVGKSESLQRLAVTFCLIKLRDLLSDGEVLLRITLIVVRGIRVSFNLFMVGPFLSHFTKVMQIELCGAAYLLSLSAWRILLN